MKHLKPAVLIIAIAAFFVGCSTTPVPFSFADDGLETAAISVVGGNPGIRVIYVDGNELPPPANKTHWDPFELPIGKPVKITVHAYYEQSNSGNADLLSLLITTAITSSRSVDQDVVFECPPLEAGKKYKLAFRKGAGLTGDNLLVLTETSKGKVVYQQEFETK
jgi:hypothetical protein